MKPEKVATICIRVTEEDHYLLKRLALENRMTVMGIIRHYIQYLKAQRTELKGNILRAISKKDRLRLPATKALQAKLDGGNIELSATEAEDLDLEQFATLHEIAQSVE